jgi:hypothetical protein
MKMVSNVLVAINPDPIFFSVFKDRGLNSAGIFLLQETKASFAQTGFEHQVQRFLFMKVAFAARISLKLCSAKVCALGLFFEEGLLFGLSWYGGNLALGEAFVNF